MERDPAFRRRQVFKRDAGVCAICEVDTLWLNNLFWHLLSLRHVEGAGWWFIVDLGQKRSRIRRLFDRIGMDWEADHIHPRHDGGGDELENLRTLCLPCHKRISRLYADRRARRARDPAWAAFVSTLRAGNAAQP